MTTALTYLACSATVLVIIIGIFRVEDARDGKLVLLTKVRLFFNRLVTYLGARLYSLDTYIGKGFARVMLHYAVHGLLERILNGLKGIEQHTRECLGINQQQL